MATSITKIAGLKELGERMSTLKNDMALKVSRAATGAGASVIKKRAVRNAPVAADDYLVEGLKVEKGNLPKNIIAKRVKPSETDLTSEHIVTVRGKRKHGYASRIGALQEFGTVKMAAQPFLRPAFDEGKEEAVQAMINRVEARLKKAGA